MSGVFNESEAMRTKNYHSLYRIVGFGGCWGFARSHIKIVPTLLGLRPHRISSKNLLYNILVMTGDEVNLRFKRERAQGPRGGEVPIHVPAAGDNVVVVPNAHVLRENILDGTLKCHPTRQSLFGIADPRRVARTLQASMNQVQRSLKMRTGEFGEWSSEAQDKFEKSLLKKPKDNFYSDAQKGALALQDQQEPDDRLALEDQTVEVQAPKSPHRDAKDRATDDDADSSDDDDSGESDGDEGSDSESASDEVQEPAAKMLRLEPLNKTGDWEDVEKSLKWIAGFEKTSENVDLWNTAVRALMSLHDKV